MGFEVEKAMTEVIVYDAVDEFALQRRRICAVFDL